MYLYAYSSWYVQIYVHAFWLTNGLLYSACKKLTVIISVCIFLCLYFLIYCNCYVFVVFMFLLFVTHENSVKEEGIDIKKKIICR